MIVTVLFGLSPSPFLLDATIVTRMEKYLDINETSASKFLRDLYMDDIITATQDVNDGFEFYFFVTALMQEGGFRKWHSNSP